MEIYRPTFKAISQTTAIKTKSQSKSLLSRYSRTLLKLCLLGVAGGTAHQGYLHHKPWSDLIQVWSKGSLPFNGQLWVGIGMASTVQVLLTFGMVSWGVSKLDFKQDIFSFPAYKPRHPNTIFKRHFSSAEVSCQLDRQNWLKLTLRDKIRISPNVYQFIFNLPNLKQPLGLPTGQHVAIRAQVGGKSVCRSYTPISDNRDLGHVDLLVKVYPTGIMTNYLDGLKKGDHVEFRGPKGAMRYTSKYSANIGMIAGGTGITPMYQIIRAICSNPSDESHVSLVYANNSESDILLRKEIDYLVSQFPQKLQVHYILLNPPSGWSGSVGYITEDVIKKNIEGPSKTSRVLLCGPPPMLTAVKKILSALQYPNPRPVSQIDDEIFIF